MREDYKAKPRLMDKKILSNKSLRNATALSHDNLDTVNLHCYYSNSDDCTSKKNVTKQATEING